MLYNRIGLLFHNPIFKENILSFTQKIALQTLIVCSSLLPFMSVAQASGMENVKGVDPITLVNKTCLGTFNTGGSAATSKGATRIKFYQKENKLAANYSRLFGAEAFQNPATTKNFDDLGEVLNLSVEGKTISFTNTIGVKFNLTVEGEKLQGELDPSATNIPNNTRKAKMELTCV